MSLMMISLVNLILIYAMFSYFVLHQPPLQIGWLLGVFTTEILGCFVLGWRKIVNSEIKSNKLESETNKSEIKIVGSEVEPTVIEKTKVSEDKNNPDVILKNKGVDLLVLARDKNLPLEFRKKYARKALKILAQIPKSSAAYIPAQYNAATAHRILGDITKAVSTYEKVREILSESGAQYTEEEHRLWAADIEMMIGNVYFEQSSLHEARSFYLRSWKIDPDNLVRILNLFDVAFKLNNVDEAQIWAEMISAHKEYPSLSSLVETKLRLLQDGSPNNP
jgi:tetratricopeptide (TPR) repeat protein